MHVTTAFRPLTRLVQISMLLLLAAFTVVSKAQAQDVPAQDAPAQQAAADISTTVAPPELPVYDQPPIPAPGYIWTPGYWAWGDDGYYWVPGTWVQPPSVGLLWTPGYWGWHDGIYAWNAGYWGPHVGFYGGINYGFGYGGVGYGGGFWRGGAFSYNTTVNNFGGVHITNVYNKTVIVNNTTNVSFNGGAGRTRAMPTAAEQAAAREHHVGATRAQAEHQHTARTNPEFRAANNGGHPAVGGTSTAGHFSGEGVTATHPHSGAAEAAGHGTTPGSLYGDHPGAQRPGGGRPPSPHPTTPGSLYGDHPGAQRPGGGRPPSPHPTTPGSLYGNHPGAQRPGGGRPPSPHPTTPGSLYGDHPGAQRPGGGPPPRNAGAPPRRVASAVRPPPMARPAPPRPAPAARPAPKGPPHHH
jgi:WXXGXW repeat (2 copies)